jgi:ribosomal protein S18 acetylase RimI-like enzyme
VVIRSYMSGDREACVGLLRSNTPEHFVAGDEAVFLAFLDDLPGPYFVVEAGDGAVIACGGIAQEDDPSIASLCWGIVAARRQREGIGTALLRHRLACFVPQHPELRCLRVNTTQKVQGFFEHHGFRATRVNAAGYGPDLDHVVMERRLSPGPAVA